MESRWRETLIFELAGRRFGVPASDVQELVRIVTITPPPPGSGPVEGVINLRGSVVPVFDLRARLGLPARPPEASESLVIVRREGRPVAFRVDRALDLATLQVGDVESAGLAGAGGDPATGVAKLPGGLAVLLDLGRSWRPPGSAGRRGRPLSWSRARLRGPGPAARRADRPGLRPDRRPGAEAGIRRVLARAGARAGPGVTSTGSGPTPSPHALDDLIAELTVGETYFFREPEQFRFLREVVLPEIRARRGDRHVLRAWSAGCASGEEAYSLAIVLREELARGPVAPAGDRHLARALARAARATLSRLVAPGRGGRRPPAPTSPRGATVTSSSSRSAGWSTSELPEPGDRRLPVVGLGGLGDGPDLLPERADLLRPRDDPGGGPAALRLAGRGGLADRRVVRPAAGGPRAVRDGGDRSGRVLPPAASRAVPARRRPPARGPAEVSAPLDAVLAEAREALAAGRLRRGRRAGRAAWPSAEALALHVRALANLDADAAERASAEATARHPLSDELHHLRAVLLLGLGRVAEAAGQARRAVYLDRTSAMAHFTLGSILVRLGDRPGAWRAYRNARDLAAARPADEPVPLSDGEPAGRLAARPRSRRWPGSTPGSGGADEPGRPPWRRLDWAEAHARLDRAAEATRAGAGPDPRAGPGPDGRAGPGPGPGPGPAAGAVRGPRGRHLHPGRRALRDRDPVHHQGRPPDRLHAGPRARPGSSAGCSTSGARSSP